MTDLTHIFRDVRQLAALGLIPTQAQTAAQRGHPGSPRHPGPADPRPAHDGSGQ